MGQVRCYKPEATSNLAGMGVCTYLFGGGGVARIFNAKCSELKKCQITEGTLGEYLFFLHILRCIYIFWGGTLIPIYQVQQYSFF